MHLAVVGTGYVGLVSAACFAELGHTVIGVDIDEAKVKKLKKGECTIYEPGLEELLKRGLKTGHLSFTTDLAEALPLVTVVFSAVATPPNKDFSADLKAVFTVAETVARNVDHDLVFVNKSTVPVGTGSKCEEKIKEILRERGVEYHIPVISNPEFLREGCAVQDTLQPDRIVVGINGDKWATELIDELYQPLTRVGKPVLHMQRESAEIVKYASNAFLATKISFINMLSELCEETGGNIRDIANGLGLDDRIGPRFLHAGIGYGGSCFPKDVKALIALSNETGIPLPIVKATHEVNTRQRMRFFQKLLDVLPDKANVAIWGLSFKPKTDDMREAPSLDLIPMLKKAGHTVRAHDPVAMGNAKKMEPDIEYVNSPMEAAKEADAVIVLTEWDAFRGVDLNELKGVMRGKHLFDGRNIYEPEEVRGAGLQYHGIGVS
ncbi:UDP-glucose 6-dehydrogenase [Candidatus Peregrinibacteria bacterium CG10_big_fil_rev_8_21_14_0_10_54_7]|nr:MAG: UDP-glucose 6-dehydrogenase [Candidatus Peregrinibacteria bacterium CG10_big_fil_rev_8_21_14_0_10_54_7]